MVAAIIIAVVPWALHIHQHRHWLYLALVLLVVACPCALVISTPVVTTCGIAQAARLGLLVKGGSYLEVLGKLKVVALDKTGTLSEAISASQMCWDWTVVQTSTISYTGMYIAHQFLIHLSSGHSFSQFHVSC